jgi:nitroreductase
MKIDKELTKLIKTRRSIRVFAGKKIPEKEIKNIIGAGIWAPTGCNMQELRFVVLSKDEDLREIIKFKPFLQGVSHFILVFYDLSIPGAKKMYEKSKHQKTLPYIDAGLALENMALFAKSKGIDSCICNFSDYYFIPETSFMKRALNKLGRMLGIYLFMKKNFKYYLRNKLRVPNHLKVIGGIALGYGKKQPDLKFAMHSGRKIMRKDTDYYILQKKKIEK